jgi:hypothetical protein
LRQDPLIDLRLLRVPSYTADMVLRHFLVADTDRIAVRTGEPDDIRGNLAGPVTGPRAVAHNDESRGS